MGDGRWALSALIAARCPQPEASRSLKMTLKKSDDSVAMTRRNFLERFGMVGGSALVMSAMHQWELLGAQAGPRPSLTGRPKNANVIVLGAGIS
jgi:hypothetical protein